MCYQGGDDVYWALYLKFRNRYFQKRGNVPTTASTTPFVETFIRNFTRLTFNSDIIGIIVEETVTLDDINIAFVYSLTRDNVVGNSGVLYHSFNNLKWFENIWPFNELYRISNVNSPVTYNIEGIVTIPFLSSGKAIVQSRL